MFMDLIIDKLINFCKFFKCTVNENKFIFNNIKKISFKDVLYFCLYMNGNSYVNNINDVSDNSFIKIITIFFRHDDNESYK
jgi:hypothetical protein